MGTQAKQIVVLEEHYGDRDLDRLLGRSPPPGLAASLYATARERVARLDRLGVETEVLALAPPGLQGVTNSEAAEIAVMVNDRLAAMISDAPGRLAGFAALPTAAPKAAADELDRAVALPGICGAMLHGPTGDRFLDHPDFDPIFERAAALDVPIYIHPAEIMANVRSAYFAPYDTTHPMFIRAGWGYTIETGTHAMRLILSGVFDRHPGLRIILGHLGEGIPFLLDRIDEALARDTPMKNFREVFNRHFSVTTSGFFSDAALACTIEQMGVGSVMFSIDAPYASAEKGLEWLHRLDLAEEAKATIAGENARRLLAL